MAWLARALALTALLHGASTQEAGQVRLEDYVKLTDARERGARDGAPAAAAEAVVPPLPAGGGAVSDPGCPYLHATLPGLQVPTPCEYEPCVVDSDGCACLLHQVHYCDQPAATDADAFCGSMATWDPALLATIERCRGEQLALDAFADCPFLEQTNMLPGAPLEYDTPCRYEACIADSDSCACLHYQRKYCEQHDPSIQDGMCLILTKERTLALDVLTAHCPPEHEHDSPKEPGGATRRPGINTPRRPAPRPARDCEHAGVMAYNRRRESHVAHLTVGRCAHPSAAGGVVEVDAVSKRAF